MINIRRYLKVVFYIVFCLITATSIFAEEKDKIDLLFSEKVKRDYFISKKIHDENNISFLEVRKLKNKIFEECGKSDSNHKQIVAGGEKLLRVYGQLIINRKVIFDRIDWVETLSALSDCYRYIPKEQNYWVNLVRASILDNILSIDLLFNSYSPWYENKKLKVYHGGTWLWYSQFVSKMNETPEVQWEYDKKILEILTYSNEEDFNLFNQFILFSDDRLNNAFSRPRVINYLEKVLISNDLKDKYRLYSLSKIYFKYLLDNEDFSKCEKYYEEKISLVKFSYPETLNKITLYDYYMQCLMIQMNFDKTFSAMRFKTEIIEEALKNFKFEPKDEFNLYDHLSRALFSSAISFKETFGISDNKKYEDLLSKASKINKEYFFDDFPMQYYDLHANILEQKLNQMKFSEIESEINAILLKIENFTVDDYHGDDIGEWDLKPLAVKKDLFQVDKFQLEAEYLRLYSSLLQEAGRHQETVNVLNKYIESKEKIFELLGDDVHKKENSIESIEIYSVYLELFKLSIMFKDKPNQKKYIKIFDQYCAKKIIGQFSCLEFYNYKIQYHASEDNVEGIEETHKNIEKLWSKVQLSNHYFSYIYRKDVLKNTLYAYSYQASKILREKGANTSEFRKYQKKLCDTSKELTNLVKEYTNSVSKNKIATDEFNDSLALDIAGVIYIQAGVAGASDNCGNVDNLIPELRLATDIIIDTQKKKIHEQLNFTSNFSKYEINSKFISQLAAGLYFMKNQLNDDDLYYEKKLRELFSLSQIGKNLYLTNSIKSSVNEENIENKDLKNLIVKRNLLEKNLEELTKEILNKPDVPSNKFKIQSNLKKNISDIDNLIKINFPKYINENKVKLYNIEDVQNKLKENEALIAFDSSNFYFGYIIQKNGFKTFSNNRVTISGLREFIDEYRKSVDPSKKTKISDHQDMLSLFYRGIFEILEIELNSNINKLIIVADKYIEDFPLGFLFDKKEKRYVIEKYSISYAPSVGTFVELRNNKTDSIISANSYFLGIGNPKLQKTSLKEYVMAISEFSLTPRGILQDQSLINKKFNNLPFTQREIYSLSKYFNNNKLLLSNKANEEEVKKLNLKNFDIIAFATHAAVSGTLKGFNEPFLVLTPPKIASELNDGILTASEISKLQLNTKLILLSACNTASKENEYSPGFSGLVAAFIRAGAQNVLATHWQVADKASSIMIIETLKKAINNKLDLAQSLQATKKEFIQGKYGEKYKNPSYWAPYVIIGD